MKSSGNLPKFTCPFLSQTEVQCKHNLAKFTVKPSTALGVALWVHFQDNQVVLYRAGSFSSNVSTASVYQSLFQCLCFWFCPPIAMTQLLTQTSLFTNRNVSQIQTVVSLCVMFLYYITIILLYFTYIIHNMRNLVVIKQNYP